VILQTSRPEHPIIQFVLNNDYEGMYRMQTEERVLFKYPPFFRMIEIKIKHKNENIVVSCAKLLAEKLREHFQENVLGPDKPTIAKIQTFFLQRILLKIEISASLTKVRSVLDEVRKEIQTMDEYKSVVLQLDMDPV